MKLVKYRLADEEGVGALTGGGVIPTRWPDFESLFGEADPLESVRGLALDEVMAIRPDRLLAPVVDRCQVIGTGGNYSEHADESRQVIDLGEPIFFAGLWSAVIGPDDEIVIPTEETKTDYEVELAVVIGKKARALTQQNAMEYVFGYTIVNDVSAREVILREPFQLMLCKSPDTFMPVGPHVVTCDELTDPYDLEIATYLNGEVRQHANTGAMTTRIPELLEVLTRTITLHPGDVVTTGTPSGVGLFRDPPEFMKPGDVITATVERVGELSNRVVAGWPHG
jgi:2-keto-4-pentenoate hydratase/2-oxohepta-3-ene-1,7-dioic acid hydratase in catechol pathway